MSDQSTSIDMPGFVTGLLETVIRRVGSQDIRAGWAMGEYLVKLGKHSFQGTDTNEVMGDVIHWLATKDEPFTEEQIKQGIAAVLKLEAEETERMLEDLTKDGMSEVGKMVESARKDRGRRAFVAIRMVRTTEGQLPNSAEQLLQLVRLKSGLPDLTLAELTVALNDFNRMSPPPPQTNR